MNQYPHTFKFNIVTAATKDANGNWTAGTTTESSAFPCREEGNGAGRKIQAQDGEAYIFSSLIYCPIDTTLPPVGSKISVYDTDGITIRAIGTVRSLYKGQLNCRIWL